MTGILKTTILAAAAVLTFAAAVLPTAADARNFGRGGFRGSTSGLHGGWSAGPRAYQGRTAYRGRFGGGWRDDRGLARGLGLGLLGAGLYGAFRYNEDCTPYGFTAYDCG